MSLLISALCIIFACLIGVWGGAMLRMHYDEIGSTQNSPTGTLVILYDSVDQEKHFALEIEEEALQMIDDGDSVVFTAKVLRQ